MKATRIESGRYSYKGWTIERIENVQCTGTLHWAILDADGICDDAASTLANAKWLIDQRAE